MVKIRFAALLLIAGVAWGDVTSIVTFPGGTNGSVQTNKSGRFNGDSYLTYSTSTHVLSVPKLSISTLTANGLTYTFPASQTGGYFLQNDGAGGLSWQTPSTFFVSSGTNLAIFDGSVRISSPTSAVVFSTAQFIVSLQGATTAAVALDPSSVTLLGQSIDISANTNLAVAAPITLTGDTIGINPSSATLLGPSIDLASEVTGTLPAGNLPATVVYTNTTQTIDGVKTFTSSITVTHARGISDTYGLVAGSVTANDLTASSAVRTDANKKLVSGGPTAAEIPGGATSYIQLGSTLQSGATFFVSSGTVGSGGLYILAGSSIITNGSQPGYFYNPTGNSWKFTGPADFSGNQSLTLSPTTITMKDAIAGPSADFSFVSGVTTFESYNSDRWLCSDLSTTCQDKKLTLNGTAIIDSTGKINTGSITHKSALLAVGGSALIGTGYSEVGDMPANGLRVIGQIVGQSSATFSGEVNATSITVTGATTSINGVKYYWPTATNVGASAKFFQVDASSNITFAASAGGGGGGSSALEVVAGPRISSPTATINFYSGDFAGTLINAVTAQIILNPATTDFIHNQEALQSATVHVSSAGVDGQVSVSSAVFISNVKSTGLGITALCVNTNNSSLGQRFCNNSHPEQQFGIYNEMDTSGVSLTADSYGIVSVNNVQSISPKKTTAGWFYAANSTGFNYGLEVNSGEASGTSANNYGVYSVANAPNSGNTAYGVYGKISGAVGSTNYAGYFDAATGSGNKYGLYSTASQGYALYVAAGDIYVSTLTASTFVKTDAFKNLVSYDLFNASPTFTSSVTVAGVGGASVGYNLNVGSITGASLSTCGDATHALGYTSTTGMFSCQALSGVGGGSGYALQPATVTIVAPGLMTPGATFYNNGWVSYAAAGSSVTFSSNTILTGTTFYQNGGAAMTNPNTQPALKITQTGNIPASSSIGGAINITNTNNTGAALVAYSNQTTPVDNLINVRVDNTAFSGQNAIFVDFRGGHTATPTPAVSIVSSGTASGYALNVVGKSTGTSSLQLAGNEATVGTFKITHTSPTITAGQSDANASAISISLAGTGTAAQGIFLDAASRTSGKLLNLRNGGVEQFVIGADGNATELYGVTAGTMTLGTAQYGVAPIVGNYTASSTATVVLADATGASLTVTLPTAVGIQGRVYTIKRTSSGANTVTINTTSAQTIDGATTAVLTTQYQSIDVISDNANWSIL